jgi:RNA polymerase sigma-70 factor, ECF subfamily
MDCLATSELLGTVDKTASDYLADFEAIARLQRPRIFRFLLASLRELDAAETLTQDCLFRAFRNREQFRGECSVDTWLMQIAVNLLRDHVKNRRLQFWRTTQRSAAPIADLHDVLVSAQQNCENVAVVQEQVRAVWEVAEKLPLKQRTVFLLKFVEDMDVPEICAATGMKPGTVKTHLFRALKTVRERLGERA